MYYKKIAFLIIVSSLLMFWIGSGCSDSDSPTGGGGGDDTTSVATLIDSANNTLAEVMTGSIDSMLNFGDSSFRPADMDFSEAHALYQAAYAQNPNSNDARFGSAFTQLMMFMADDTLNTVYEEFKNLFDTVNHNPFYISKHFPQIEFGNEMMPMKLPLSPNGFTSLLPAPMKLDYALMSAAEGNPKMSEFQDVIEFNFLPDLLEAQTKLEGVVADASYTFEITPEMQGNSGASSILLDHSDFRVILGGLYAMEATLRIFIARNLDFPDYSLDSITTAIQQNSTFLNLRADGETQFSEAKNKILLAEEQIDSAFTSLISEIGSDQSNDLIKVYPNDLQNLLDGRDTLRHYASYFDGVKELKVKWTRWEGYPYYWYVTDSILIDVDIRQFFDNPVSNPKSLLPGYTVELSEIDDNSYKTFADQNFSVTQYWYMMDSLYGIQYPNDTTMFPYHLPDNAQSQQFYDILAMYPYYSQFVLGWNDVYSYCSPGNTNIYCFESWYSYNYQSLYNYSNYYLSACYTWTANDYATWSWPDATFNGLFPNYTEAELKDFILDDPSEWKKTDCDTTSVRSDLDFWY